MTQSSIQKDQFTAILRQQLIASIAHAQETDRADDSLCTLSFQSALHPERHAWIDTTDQIIKIDLEDWTDEDEWDNAIARITLSEDLAIELLQDWFMGSKLENYSNLNKTYGVVTKRLVAA